MELKMIIRFNFKLIFIVLLCPITARLLAQDHLELKGKIVDSEQKPIELATVKLYQAADSSLISSAFSEKNGDFLIQQLKASDYYFSIEFLGLEKYNSERIALQKNTIIPTVTMLPQVGLLSEVQIKSKAPFIERKLDRVVVNMEALLSSAGTTTWEALEKAPGVMLDQNGNILLRGRSGVQVFIDDKPSYLSGIELENYLKTLPTSSIKQIEILTNPPAKYDAAGNSGIINIVTKRSKQIGFTGNVNTAYTQGRYARTNHSLGLNYLTSKIGIYGNVSLGTHQSFQDLNIYRFYKNDDLSPRAKFEQNSYIKKTNQSINSRLILDYYLTSKTTLGMAYSNVVSPKKDKVNNTAFYTSKTDLNKIIADNLSTSKFLNHSANINIRHALDQHGSQISADADLIQYSSQTDQDFYNFIYQKNNQLIYDDFVEGNLPSDIRIYTVKSDLTTTIKGIKFETGIKSAFTNTDNIAEYFTTIDQQRNINNDLSNHFIYKEWIQSAYMNFSKTIYGFECQIGLRGEHTNLKGDQKGNAIKAPKQFSNQYTKLFPTFFASRALDSAGIHVVNFSYGRRIDRPIFQHLNPFVSPLDKYTYYVGNPDLLPTFSNNFSLTHSYKNKINTSINFSKTINGINETLEIVGDIYYSRPLNVTTNYNTSISIDANHTFKKWYTVIPYFEFGNVKYKSKLYTEQLNANGNYVIANLTQSFKLKKNWSAELKGDYQSDIVYSQLIIKRFAIIGFTIQKKFAKGNATARAGVNDIFYTRTASGIINNLKNTDANWDSTLDTRSLVLSLAYRFGKSNIQKQQYKTTGAESEKRRIQS